MSRTSIGFRPSILSASTIAAATTGFYNSKAFQMAGITKNTPNPYGGTYDRNDKGELNGRVTDLAMLTIDKAGERVTYTAAVKQKRVLDGVAFISQKFVQYGLTTVHHDEEGGAAGHAGAAHPWRTTA